MKLFLLTFETELEWDFFRSVVVAAADEAAARRIHPEGGDFGRVDADGWVDSPLWAESPDDVKAQLLGEAVAGVEAGVICAHFVSGGE